MSRKNNILAALLTCQWLQWTCDLRLLLSPHVGAVVNPTAAEKKESTWMKRTDRPHHVISTLINVSAFI